MNHHLRLANMLVRRGAQWNVKNTQGMTPLDLAMQNSKGDMIKLLNVRVGRAGEWRGEVEKRGGERRGEEGRERRGRRGGKERSDVLS